MKLMEYRKSDVEIGYELLKKQPELIKREKDKVSCNDDAPLCIKAVVNYENFLIEILKEMEEDSKK